MSAEDRTCDTCSATLPLTDEGRMACWTNCVSCDAKQVERAALLLELREALEELYSVQNGCPLPKYEQDWNAAIAATHAVLAKADEMLGEKE